MEKTFRFMEKNTSGQLIVALSNFLRRPLNTSTDYEFLSETIQHRTGEYVSATTLKRMGGYLTEKVDPRRTTLDILSRALGYKDLEEFERNIGAGVPDSNPSEGVVIESAKQEIGFTVDLSWLPDRRCTLRYSGQNMWEVIESEHTRLKAGQKLECHYIIDKEPLEVVLLPDSTNPDNLTGMYICGRKYGIRIDCTHPKSLFHNKC